MARAPSHRRRLRSLRHPAPVGATRSRGVMDAHQPLKLGVPDHDRPGVLRLPPGGRTKEGLTMVDLNAGRTRVKRGGFARDTRTGQVVKVAEMGGRDALVRPAYKSDGYWVDHTYLAPATDPHAWGWSEIVKLLLALLASVFAGYGWAQDLTAHGYSTGDAFWYSLPGGILVFWFVAYFSRLFRD